MISNPKHILRYGTNAEQKYINKLKNHFDLLAINGNMLAFTPGAVASFLMMLLCKTSEVTGYFIDPITHAFQHDISKIMSFSKKQNKYVIKESVKKLMKSYGEPIDSVINSGVSITPKHFNSQECKETFCKNVIDFQLTTIVTQLIDKGFMEYIEYSDYATNLTDKLQPYFIIPPYFYLDSVTSNFNEWLSLNIDFIKIAKSNFRSHDIYAQLVISKDVLLSKKIRDQICEEYIASKPKGVLLWIDDFDEHEVSCDLLIGFCDVVRRFNNSRIKIYNLYGGFFSIILTGFISELDFELNGVGHALEYGESRRVVPVGGGIPTNKYYYYPLHYRLDYRRATSLLNNFGYFSLPSKEGAKKYFKNICSCHLCKEVIQDDINNFSKFENTEFYEVVLRGIKQRRSYASQDTKEICVMHYQLNKVKEFKVVDKKPLTVFLKELELYYEKYSKYSYLIPEPLQSMSNWLHVIKHEYKR